MAVRELREFGSGEKLWRICIDARCEALIVGCVPRTLPPPQKPGISPKSTFRNSESRIGSHAILLLAGGPHQPAGIIISAQMTEERMTRPLSFAPGFFACHANVFQHLIRQFTQDCTPRALCTPSPPRRKNS